MSLFKVFDIAGSAMSAQSVRLNTVASNMANADSVSSSVENLPRQAASLCRPAGSGHVRQAGLGRGGCEGHRRE